MKAVNVRLDKFHDKFDAVHDKIDGVRTDLTSKIDELSKDTAKEFTAVRAELGAKIDSTHGKIDGVRSDLAGKIDGVRSDLAGKIDGVRTDLTSKIDEFRKDTAKEFTAVRAEIGGIKDSFSSAKVWALWLYIGLGVSLFSSLLYAMARGFKWI